MEQLPENNPAQSDKSDDITEATLGKVLREAREHLGLSVADVANQIKFAPRQIGVSDSMDGSFSGTGTRIRSRARRARDKI